MISTFIFFLFFSSYVLQSDMCEYFINTIKGIHNQGVSECMHKQYIG